MKNNLCILSHRRFPEYLSLFCVNNQFQVLNTPNAQPFTPGTYRVALYQAERRAEEESERLKQLELQKQRDMDILAQNEGGGRSSSNQTRSKFCILI